LGEDLVKAAKDETETEVIETINLM
jgi:hypothetical protein